MNPESYAQGGTKEKFKANIEAIRLVRKLEELDRSATEEEYEILGQYTGWGAFPQLFDPYNYEWRKERDELGNLLGDEYEAVRRSVLNAHFTAPPIAIGMWQMARRMGFTGGRTLEPAVGNGMFFGTMPEDIKAASQLTGVELEPLTARIARELYPSATILNRGFETFQVPDDFYDIAISNVPFGKYKLFEKRYAALSPTIHNHFFLRAVDKVRPGGLVVFITSTWTMDGQSPRIRRALASKADLVAAMRLPGHTFFQNAGTAVVTDIIILRKRTPGEPASGAEWESIGQLPNSDTADHWHATIPVNIYYQNHPEQILGNLDMSGRMQAGPQKNVTRTDDFEQRFADAIARLPEGAFLPRSAPEVRPVIVPQLEGRTVKNGSLSVVGGKVFVNNNGGLEAVNAVSADDTPRVEALLGVGAALREVLAAEFESRPDVEIEAARKALNAAYDGFVKKYGQLHSASNHRILKLDRNEGPAILSLEQWDNEKKAVVGRADVFSKRVVSAARAFSSHAQSANDAVAISLAAHGRLDVGYISDLLGKSVSDASRELLDSGLAFEDPATADALTLRDAYLSGNVGKKLAAATAANEASRGRYARNVEELTKVVPEDVPFHEIHVRLGSPWVPPSDVSDFVAHMPSPCTGDEPKSQERAPDFRDASDGFSRFPRFPRARDPVRV